MCKEYTAPRSQKDSRPFASIDANQKIDPILNIGSGLIVDVPGIEVQVPSLSDLWRSRWILASSDQERFVNEIHRHQQEIVNDNRTSWSDGSSSVMPHSEMDFLFCGTLLLLQHWI